MVIAMLADRHTDVLETIVRDYVAEAVPVSSRRILEIGDFDLSPASIRGVMADLEDAGYIFQPHTSAGRVPTQKGYRFFVDHIMKPSASTPSRLANRIRAAGSLPEALKTIARETHLYVFITSPTHDAPINFGLAELFQEPEFQDTEFIVKFGRLIDAVLEKHMVYAEAIQETGFGVFIENENMLPEARCASVVIGALPGTSGFLCTLGPARMDYERTASIVRLSAHILEHTGL